MKVETILGRFSKGGNQAQQQLRGTELGSLAIAQVEPPRGERCRAGRRFGGGTQIIANGIAPVQVLPTTTATLALYNGESDGGKSYLVDHIHAFLGSGIPAIGLTLLLCVSPAKIAAPGAASVTGYSSGNLSGSALATKARWLTAVTLPSTPVAPAWIAVLSSLQPAAANVGQGDQPYQNDGGILVPPGYALGVAIFSGVGTAPLYGISATWDELEMDLE